MTPVLAKWWHLLFQAPPSPPDDLVDSARELRRAAVAVRREARKQRQMIDRLGDVTGLVHRNGHDPWGH